MAQRAYLGGRLFTVFMIAAVALHFWTVLNALAYWGILGATAAFMLPIVAELAVAWKLWSLTGHLATTFTIAAALVIVGWYPAAVAAASLGRSKTLRERRVS